MSQGFLLFAHDNPRVDYGVLAAWTAYRIHKWLDKPVSLAADVATVNNMVRAGVDLSLFDRIITSNGSTSQVKRYHDDLVVFQNFDRSQAWELTPYDETIVIDTDVVIQSSMLNKLWGSAHSMIACQKSRHVLGHPHTEFDYISQIGAKFFWATEFYFRKNDESKLFFDTCKWIKENYWWHAKINEFDARLMRNDFLWSLTIHLLGGPDNSDWMPIMPWTLPYSMDKGMILEVKENSIVLGHESQQLCRVTGKDVHVMNKIDLQQFAKKELGIAL